MTRPRLAFTVGDPAGIGPEICEKAAADARVREVCEPMVFGGTAAECAARFPPGRLSAGAGRAAYDAIVAAVDAVREGRADGLVTAPVNKEAFALAGLPWKGHTDLLAALTGAPRAVMLFTSDRLRVALATVHIPLAEVPGALSVAGVEATIRLAAECLPALGCPRARVAVAGLNPHAGEHGLMGREEADVLAPAIALAAADGIDVSGPYPGDTVFNRALKGEFDVVVACYHDQGLIPVKLTAFGTAVNVTLGLPIVRTSVDHGTAFDIAGRGVADAGSLVEAARVASRLVRARTAAAGARG
jgi:4-hydroxythreonine-4-phosphate dehydrogenase